MLGRERIITNTTEQKEKATRKGYTRRKDGRLQRKVRVDGVDHFIYGQTYKECEEKELALRNKVAHGILVNKERITLSEYYKEWQSNRTGSVKPSTQRNNKGRWGSVEKELGHMRLVDITPRHVKALQKKLAESDIRPDTVNRKVALLSSVLQSAVYDKILISNPCERILKLKDENPAAADTIHRALEDWELDLFLEEAERSSWFFELYCLMLQTGCRCGEIAALEWEDIDYETGFIKINKTVTTGADRKPCVGTAKTKNSIRQVPLTDNAKAILTAQKRKCQKLRGNVISIDERKIFYTYSGELITSPRIGNDVKAVIERINKRDGVHLNHFGSHAFRDTYATRCIEQGMNPNTLKKILGHSSLAVTMDLYAHVMPNTMKREIANVTLPVRIASGL